MASTLENIVKIFKRSILRDPFLLAHKAWRQAEGDKTLRLDYDLDHNSIVFDVGGYIGDFAQSIHAKYGCTVYLFEPSKHNFERCVQRFAGNDKIIPLNYGLSDQTGEFWLSDDGDGASVFRDTRSTGELVEMRAIGPEINRLGIKNIDLVKLNIEGGEFPLLQYLLVSDLIRRIRFLQIQFHDFFPEASVLRDSIRSELARTHTEQWCFTFLWESWERKL
ncbi:methyltransferase, FkbM family [Cohaesibacter sp. ES.047]|uniref:FkbM family methyltransferase n=1 Tax=Cohaesibacter sp. ES.047 TaxID=1798205 RepID=UPI000BB943D2|nr:FkbM family methyltransferase [Cohaesibacter sp. ES.047]SNY90491.1 methyltransferase, FkbM family [Cohaesibacter sp. ES.047]